MAIGDHSCRVSFLAVARDGLWCVISSLHDLHTTTFEITKNIVVSDEKPPEYIGVRGDKLHQLAEHKSIFKTKQGYNVMAVALAPERLLERGVDRWEDFLLSQKAIGEQNKQSQLSETDLTLSYALSDNFTKVVTKEHCSLLKNYGQLSLTHALI